MFQVYVLKSEGSGRYYIGQTKDVIERLQRHNKGRSKFTKVEKPWRLVYSESYETRSEAIRRERYLKSSKGWVELQEIKNKFEPRNVAQPG